MDRSDTFSESWHRVAGQRVALRASVSSHRQHFRGEPWTVLRDPFANQFFRLRPAAYDFVARLRMDRTVEEVWKEALDENPDEAPGQEEVIQLLAQLYHANLLHSDVASDAGKLFDRYKKRRQREIRSRLASIMFVRVPLFDPDDFLKRTLPYVAWIFSPAGAAIWLLVVGFAVKTLADHAGAFWDQSQAILAPANLPLLYVCLVGIKALHELGHAYACRRHGGEVHTMGLMFLIFTPVPYMDATSSWAFRERWRRILVSSAGMLVELFVAALAVFVWAGTGEGTVHAIAYNLIFIASVSTVLFNANPLLRFDGYYVLSDLLEIPNLHTRSTRMARHLVERHAFGFRRSKTPARTREETAILLAFFVLSGVYRVFLFASIILFVADQYLLLGAIMAATCIVAWGVRPVVKLVGYLTSDPRLARTRPRAVLVTVGAIGIAFVALSQIPFPNHVRAPGIVRSEGYVQVFAEASGFVEEQLVASGTGVEAGQPLVRLRNRELDLELRSAEAQLEEARAELQRAIEGHPAALVPIRERIEALTRRRERLELQRAALLVRAPGAGIWVAVSGTTTCGCDWAEMKGLWITRGARLGEVVDPSSFRFTAVVSQRAVGELFLGDRLRGAEVRLRGRADRALSVADVQVTPAQQERLPSRALGWLGGGSVALSGKDAEGILAAEPFFEVRALLENGEGLHHGASGQIRFTLAPEPLLVQWRRQLRQLVQERYRF